MGSVKKIAKPVLPYSVHATGSNSQELKQLQEMLKSDDLTSSEKMWEIHFMMYCFLAADLNYAIDKKKILHFCAHNIYLISEM